MSKYKEVIEAQALQSQIAKRDEQISQLVGDLESAQDKITSIAYDLAKYMVLGCTPEQVKNALHFCETRGFDPKVNTL